MEDRKLPFMMDPRNFKVEQGRLWARLKIEGIKLHSSRMRRISIQDAFKNEKTGIYKVFQDGGNQVVKFVEHPRNGFALEQDTEMAYVVYEGDQTLGKAICLSVVFYPFRTIRIRRQSYKGGKRRKNGTRSPKRVYFYEKNKLALQRTIMPIFMATYVQYSDGGSQRLEEQTWKQVLESRLFRVYNKITAKQIDTTYNECPPLEVDDSVGIKSEWVDQEVYDRFKRFVNLQKNPVGNSWYCGAKLKPCHSDVTVNDIVKLLEVQNGTRSRIAHEEVEGGFSYVQVPKSVKRNGKMRFVYPMSLKLNLYIAQEYGDQQVKSPDYCELVTGCGFSREFKHTYDVKACDHMVLPYFERLVRERYPQDLDKLLAKVVNIDGKMKELTQFPSGIGKLMKSVIPAFTMALVPPGVECQVQGDGIAAKQEINFQRLYGTSIEVVKEEPCTINGFDYSTGTPCYAHAAQKLAMPHIKGTNRLKGEPLWQLRYFIYEKVLNAKDMPPPRKNSSYYPLYSSLSREELLHAACEHEVMLQLLERYGIDLDPYNRAIGKVTSRKETATEADNVTYLNAFNSVGYRKRH